MPVVLSGIASVSPLIKGKGMKNQRGMTLIGWVIVLALIAFFATLIMRLLPMYQEYYGVLQVMSSLEEELEGNNLSKNQVELLLLKKFDTGYIKSVKSDNIEILRGKNSAYITKVVIDYEVRKPFIAHIDLVGHFKTEIDTEPKRQ
jgi:Tfp pilus assembly major pilin PilA